MEEEHEEDLQQKWNHQSVQLNPEIMCRNIVEMIRARKYEIPEIHLTDMESLREHFDMKIYKVKQRSLLITYPSQKVSKEYIDDKESGLIAIAKQNKVKDIIIICFNLTNPARTSIDSYKNMHISIFFEKEFMFNPTQHRLVPIHKGLSNKKAQEIMETYHFKPEQMPKLLKSDAICKYYGFHVGQMIEISQKDRHEIHYRIVVDDSV